jgi:hypothetical protein
MQLFLVAQAALLALTIAMLIVAAWVSRRSSTLRNVASFCLSAVASYAVGFALDICVSAVQGEIPRANVVLPTITWLWIATASLYSAGRANGSPIACAAPFWLNAGLAALASFSRGRNLVIAATLLLIGVFVSQPSRPQTIGEIEDIDSPAIQESIQRLRRIHHWTMWARPLTLAGTLFTAFWLVYLVFRAFGFVAAFGCFLGLSFVYNLGASPMFAVASSVLTFYFHAVGLWLPITSYVLAALLLYIDTFVDGLKQRVDPFNLGSTHDE